MVLPNGMAFQLDIAPYHMQKLFRNGLKNMTEFRVLNQPPNYPDLQPIKRLPDMLDRRVRSMEVPPHRLQDLKEMLVGSLSDTAHLQSSCGVHNSMGHSFGGTRRPTQY